MNQGAQQNWGRKRGERTIGARKKRDEVIKKNPQGGKKCGPYREHNQKSKS